MSNLLKLTPENYYTKEANMQYVSVSQYKEFNGTTGKMGCEAYAMANGTSFDKECYTLWKGKFTNDENKDEHKYDNVKNGVHFLHFPHSTRKSSHPEVKPPES